jgi:hypothetical protein
VANDLLSGINCEVRLVQAAKAEMAAASFLSSVQGIRMAFEGMSISTAFSTRKWTTPIILLKMFLLVGLLNATCCCCRFSRFTIAVGAVGKDGKRQLLGKAAFCSNDSHSWRRTEPNAVGFACCRVTI